jgi:hypothetical protein
MCGADGCGTGSQICMDAANKEIDPNEEESKGGSGAVGKMLMSGGEEGLALLNYVPPAKLDTVDAEEWMKATLKEVGGDVHMVKTSKATCSAYIKQDQASNR